MLWAYTFKDLMANAKVIEIFTINQNSPRSRIPILNPKIIIVKSTNIEKRLKFIELLWIVNI